MIRIYLLSLLLLLASIGPIKAQNSPSSFSTSVAYAEAGVLGFFGFLAGLNLNYEHKIYANSQNNLNLYGRGGVAASGVLFGSGGFGGLLGASLLTGPNNHHFEADLGIIIGKNDGSGGNDVFFQPLGEIGYRFQAPEGGFLFKAKAGITGFGIGLGYAF